MVPVLTQARFGAQGWTPPPFQTPALRPRLAQTVVTTPSTPPGANVARPPLIDSALVSFIFDVFGATAYGMLTYGSKTVGAKNWTVIFGAITGALTLKALLDLSAIRTR